MNQPEKKQNKTMKTQLYLYTRLRVDTDFVNI